MAHLLEQTSSHVLGTVLLSLIIIYVVYNFPSSKSRSAQLPPGPAGWPIIGNMFDLPVGEAFWVEYHTMCKNYDSDIIYLNVLGKPIVILDTLEAINELLEKHSANFSSRPRLVMLLELMGWRNFAALPYGSLWRSHRRLFREEFDLQKKEDNLHHAYLIRGVNESLRRLLESPDQWFQHLKHQAAETILEIAYGPSPKKDQDARIHAMEDVLRCFADIQTPGKYIVETLPWLKYVPAWIPGAFFRTIAQEGNKAMNLAIIPPFEDVKAAMASGTAQPSFTSRSLEKIDPNGDIAHQESNISDVAGTMFAAGADTIADTMITFILAMSKHPDIQAKAQLELDTVLGPHNIPTFADKDSLPYLNAVVKECLRWEPLAPIAAPHLSVADDTYKGYYIPDGTLAIPNTWAVLHDESMYPDADRFNPDRFLTKDGDLDPLVRDPEAAFGYGRRICPGRKMARDALWLSLGAIFACFSINKSVDLQGNVIEPSGRYISGLLRAPESFPCSIKPRSVESVKAIKELFPLSNEQY